MSDLWLPQRRRSRELRWPLRKPVGQIAVDKLGVAGVPGAHLCLFRQNDISENATFDIAAGRWWNDEYDTDKLLPIITEFGEGLRVNGQGYPSFSFGDDPSLCDTDLQPHTGIIIFSYDELPSGNAYVSAASNIQTTSASCGIRIDSGGVSIYVRGTAQSPTTTFGAGKLHVVAYSISDTRQVFFHNGEKTYESSLSTWWSTPSYLFRISQYSASTVTFYGFAYLTNTELSDIELSDISRDPWSLLVDDRSSRRFLSGGTGGITVNAACIVPYSNASSMNIECLESVDWLSSFLSYCDAVYSNSAGVDGYESVPVGILLGVDSDALSHSDNLASTEHDNIIPISWQGALVVNATRDVHIDWESVMKADCEIQKDSAASRLIGAAYPIEYATGLSVSDVIPLSVLAGVTGNRIIPTEWSGTILVASDSRIPIDWFARLQSDAFSKYDHLQTVLVERDIPAEFDAGIIVDYRSAVEWLTSVGISEKMFAEWGGAITVNAARFIPIEWGSEGVVAFITGNVNVWKISERGVVWRIQARGVVWKP